MIEIKTKLKRWENSFKIIIPNKIIKQINLKEGEEVIILFRKKRNNFLREMFGFHKFSKPTAQLMREMDKELYDN